MRRSVLLLSLALFGGTALAAGKKPPTPPPPAPAVMKRAITLDPIADHYIELPDPTESGATYGSNIYANLIDDLVKTGDYAVLVDDGPQVTAPKTVAAQQSLAAQAAPDPCLINMTPPDSSSHITINVNELSFSVGDRGERMYYGYKQGFENAYNAGVDQNSRN